MSSQPPQTITSAATTTADTVKFLCSYGGKIIPRPSDGLLRYVGGVTRVFSAPRTTSFSELSEKLHELCGYAATLRCQLPTEDLDVLVTIKSDEDLKNIIEEYDKATKISGKEMKIRAILSSPKSLFKNSLSTPASPVSSPSSSPDISPSPAADQHRWNHRKPPMSATMQRNIPRRVYQYKVVGDCYHNYYPSHLQSSSSSSSRSRPRSSFYFSPQHSNLWH